MVPGLILQEQGTVHSDDGQGILWRDVLCYLKVKVQENENPLREESEPRLRESVAQGADYTLIHAVCHPFRLFSIGVTIYNSHFGTSVYDRGGVRHSPRIEVFDVQGVTKDFTRVIQRLSQDLTEQEFSLGPTVFAVHLADRSLFPTSVGIRTVSSALIDSISRLDCPLKTEGGLICAASSVLGQGTTAWRSLSGDAKISASPLGAKLRLDEDIILHRVAPGSVAKPLWEYATAAGFICALIAAVDSENVICTVVDAHAKLACVDIAALEQHPDYKEVLVDLTQDMPTTWVQMPSEYAPGADLAVSHPHVFRSVNLTDVDRRGHCNSCRLIS